jgi:hypothetical protein
VAKANASAFRPVAESLLTADVHPSEEPRAKLWVTARVGRRHATNRSRVNRPQRSKELRSPRSAQWERPLRRNSCDTDSGTNPGERNPATPLPHPQNRSSHKTKTEETRQIRLRLSARSCSNDSAHNDRDSRGTLTQHDPELHHLHDPHETAPRQGRPETLAQANARAWRQLGAGTRTGIHGFLIAALLVMVCTWPLSWIVGRFRSRRGSELALVAGIVGRAAVIAVMVYSTDRALGRGGWFVALALLFIVIGIGALAMSAVSIGALWLSLTGRVQD